MLYEWQLTPPPDVPPELRAAVGGHPLVAELLARRGLTDPAQALAFLDPAHYRPTPPEALPGMETAVALLREAIRQSQRVRICGDFDADGHTSTAVLMEALLALGAQVDYRLPERDEGHGLNRRIVEGAVADGIGLLLTCDTGIGDADLVAIAAQAGITVIVTDHHDLPETLPPAQAILNPKMLPTDHALHELAGVGVAYLLARGLLTDSIHNAVLTALLDLVALGLVADVATQVGEVRHLIQRGLAVMQLGQRPGLAAMAQVAGFDLAHADEETVGYQIGPRLNAAGRLADSAHVVRMLLTRDPAEALRLAQDLEALNRDRRARTDALLHQTEQRLASQPDLAREAAIIIDGDGWEPAVLGLVAGSLARRYDRPAVLIARRPDGTGLGSARSVEGIDIHQAIVSQRALLAREGGHPMAAGFTLTSITSVNVFRQGLLHHLRAEVPARRPQPQLAVDAEVPWSEANLELARELNRLRPFGPGNPRPTLVLRAGALERSEVLGSQPDSAHRRLFVSHGANTVLNVVWFNAGPLPQGHEPVDLALHVMENHWRGNVRAEFHLVDWQPAAASKAAQRLVEGREVVDWRDAPDAYQRLAELRQSLGEGLAIWAEAPSHPWRGRSAEWNWASAAQRPWSSPARRLPPLSCGRWWLWPARP
jgi:single-stranded-DNA-specific exonuclease